MFWHVSALTFGHLQEAFLNICSLCSSLCVQKFHMWWQLFNHHNNNFNHMWNFWHRGWNISCISLKKTPWRWPKVKAETCQSINQPMKVHISVELTYKMTALWISGSKQINWFYIGPSKTNKKKRQKERKKQISNLKFWHAYSATFLNVWLGKWTHQTVLPPTRPCDEVSSLSATPNSPTPPKKQYSDI